MPVKSNVLTVVEESLPMGIWAMASLNAVPTAVFRISDIPSPLNVRADKDKYFSNIARKLINGRPQKRSRSYLSDEDCLRPKKHGLARDLSMPPFTVFVIHGESGDGRCSDAGCVLFEELGTLLPAEEPMGPEGGRPWIPHCAVIKVF